MNIDLTQIIQAVIALLASVITYKLVPWIKSKASEQQFENLTAMAKVAVYAAEQIFNAGENDKKLEYAINQLKKAGFEMDEDTLREAIEKAVFDLKLTTDTSSLLPCLTAESTEDGDLSFPALEDWPLEMIVNFCEVNSIPHDGCVTKEEYIAAIVGGALPENEPDVQETGE